MSNNNKYILGKDAVWNHFSIADIFADPFIDSIKRFKERPSPPFHCIASSIQIICESLAKIIKRTNIR